MLTPVWLKCCAGIGDSHARRKHPDDLLNLCVKRTVLLSVRHRLIQAKCCRKGTFELRRGGTLFVASFRIVGNRTASPGGILCRCSSSTSSPFAAVVRVTTSIDGDRGLPLERDVVELRKPALLVEDGPGVAKSYASHDLRSVRSGFRSFLVDDVVMTAKCDEARSRSSDWESRCSGACTCSFGS